jgi:serine/threonine protein kinase
MSKLGNFSVVKECTNKMTGVRYAIKCINKTALNTKDRSNLVQEINILKEVRQ